MQKQLERDRGSPDLEEADKNLYKFDEEEILCAEIAGLCHDLGNNQCNVMYILNVILQARVHRLHKGEKGMYLCTRQNSNPVTVH